MDAGIEEGSGIPPEQFNDVINVHALMYTLYFYHLKHFQNGDCRVSYRLPDNNLTIYTFFYLFRCKNVLSSPRLEANLLQFLR